MRVRPIAPVTGALQPVDLEEAQIHTRADCAEEEVLLGSLISVATQAATDRLQRALVPTRYRLTLDSFPDAIELLMPPIMTKAKLGFQLPAMSKKPMMLAELVMPETIKPNPKTSPAKKVMVFFMV